VAAPEALSPAADALVVAAERKAVHLAAVVRSGVALLLLALFTLRRPPGLPPGFAALVQIGLLVNIAVAALSWWIAARSPRGWRSGTFFVLSDFVIVMVATGGTLHLLALPPSLFGAMPAFLLSVSLLSFATLRYSPWSVALLTLGIAGIGTVLTLLPASGPLTELPIFSPTANSFRVVMLTATGAVLTYVVLRGRRMLVEAVSVGERAANLSRYLPQPVADLVARQGIDALSRGRSQEAAVLFADIVGFTAMTERMAPEQVGHLLTELRAQQREMIEQAGGIVDKFIGDAVMAVFGVPEPHPAAAAQALQAADAIRSRLAAWNRERAARGEPALAVGIGVHFGAVFAGAVGDARRLEFATLGDTVNVAQRCEHLTREVGSELIVTGDVLRAAGDDLTAWEPIPARTLRGRDGLIELFRPAA
jgi:adenylate cyclase